jgi:hypothetical protein
MSIGMRDFMGAALAAEFSAVPAQKNRSPGRPAAAPPMRTAKVEKLFKAPDIYTNALEAAGDGLWIGDQVSERLVTPAGVLSSPANHQILDLWTWCAARGTGGAVWAVEFLRHQLVIAGEKGIGFGDARDWQHLLG